MLERCRRALVLALILVVVAVGCSGELETSAPPVLVPVGARLGGVDGVGAVFAGTSPQQAAMRVSEAPALALPAGVLALGRGLRIEADRPVTGRVEVRLVLPRAPNDEAVPAVLHVHHDGTRQVEPALFDPVTNEAVVRVDEFSDRFGGWWSPASWAEHVGRGIAGGVGFIADWMTGRTDPPPCRNDPPAWSSHAAAGMTSLHVCAQANPASDGAERLEVLLKSNRQTIQLVTVPSGTDYVWLGEDPEWLRRLRVGLLRANPTMDHVLLGGASLSAGFRRPSAPNEVRVSAHLTWPIIVVNPLVALLGLGEADEVEAMMLATYSCFREIAGFDPARLDAVPTGHADRASFVGSMVRCAVDVVANPELAAHTLDTVLNQLQVGVVERNQIVARSRKVVDRAGPIAKKLLRVLAVGGVLTSSWDSVIDNAAESNLTVTLLPLAPPTTTAKPTTTVPTLDLTLDRTGLGPLRFGMKADAATATRAAGPYDQVVPDVADCGMAAPGPMYRDGDFSILYLDRRLARFYVASGRVRTPHGIGVGSPSTALSKVEGRRSQQPNHYDERTTQVRFTEGGVGYQFDVRNGKVVEWSVGTPEALGLAESCA